MPGRSLSAAEPVRIEAGIPALVAERWIGDDVIKGLERVEAPTVREPSPQRSASLDPPQPPMDHIMPGVFT